MNDYPRIDDILRARRALEDAIKTIATALDAANPLDMIGPIGHANAHVQLAYNLLTPAGIEPVNADQMALEDTDE